MRQSIPISILLENAEEETRTAIENIRQKYSLRPCIMDVIVSAVLADVRNDAKTELISATNEMLAQKNEELEKAKEEAKRVLRNEPEKKEENQQEKG
ncbi:MAG: hypothetical protein Q4C58_07540 [Eubacteriales bacterium]|nr:hypothetical protein [Eubacteriales bacterium]